MENLKKNNSFIITCVCCIVLLLTLTYFGVNNYVKGTKAATYCENCPSGWTEVSDTSMYCTKTFTYYNDNATQSCVEGIGTCTTTIIDLSSSPKYQHYCNCQRTRHCETDVFDNVSCSAGKYYNGSVCVTCPANSYCPGGNFINNNTTQGKYSCPTGTTSLAGSISQNDCKTSTSKQKCPSAGQYYNGSSCVSCTPGNYCPSSSDSLIRCPAGNYCPSGVSSPITCPANHYCDTGATTPIDCPPQKPYSPSGSTSVSDCTASGSSSNNDDKSDSSSMTPNKCWNCGGTYEWKVDGTGCSSVNNNVTSLQACLALNNSGGVGGGNGGGSNNKPSSNLGVSSNNSNNSNNSGGTGIGGNTNDNNITTNPQTGNILIFLIWMIGLVMIGYSVYYFKNIKNNQ